MSHTTSSQEDLRIYLVRRNYCFWKEKTPVDRIFAKGKNGDEMAQGMDISMKDNIIIFTLKVNWRLM